MKKLTILSWFIMLLSVIFGENKGTQTNIMYGILIGGFIGYVIAKVWDWYIITYGVDGHAEVDKYMEDKYGKDWFEQMFKKE